MFHVHDLPVFFTDFGVPATIAGQSVTVIFDNEYLAAMDVESSNPVALAASSDVSAVAQGDAAVIDGVNYTVASVQPDGTGMTVLELEKA